MISKRVFAKNALWNLAAQVVPAFVALVAVRYLIKGLGDDAFGVLTLAWTTIGYFSLFDLGLGRALTQSVSVALGAEDQEQLESIGMTSLLIMFVMGVVGGIALAAASRWIVTSFLNIDPVLQQDALGAFHLLAASLPFVVMTAGLRGLLEAHQDFAVATALRVPFAIFSYVGPLAMLPWSRSLRAAVAVLVVGRILMWATHLAVCLRRYPYLRRGRVSRGKQVAALVVNGGWMTVSNVVSPLMVQADRFVIGAILSMAAVAYYVTPFEMVYKLLMIPAAILGVFFPAFATAYAASPARASRLFDGNLRILVLLMYPASLIFVAFAREILLLWVGPDYADHSAAVMRWLAIGVFINSLAQVPFSALQAMGRADLTAKLHAIEFPLYIATMLLLGTEFGVTGVAIAWTLRIAFDTVALFWLARQRLPNVSLIVRQPVFVIGALVAILGAATLPTSPIARGAVVAVTMIVFLVGTWSRGLLTNERALVLRTLGIDRGT